jgi:glycerol uptake facilitator protein
MTPFLAELIGTALLVLLGDGVVANVVLNKTKGHGAGWIVITFGWGMAVFVAGFITAPASSAHLNPAATIGLAVAGKFDWEKVPMYIAAQMAGACLGAVLVWLQYKDHFSATNDADAKLATFCTGPAIPNPASNLISEVIGTFVLVFAALHIANPEGRFASIHALPIGFVVFAIGLSLGGTTGYAINPARDLGPRLMHALLPIPGKRDSNWTYAWIPVIGPILGGVLAAILYRFLATSAVGQ